MQEKNLLTIKDKKYFLKNLAGCEHLYARRLNKDHVYIS